MDDTSYGKLMQPVLRRCCASGLLQQSRRGAAEHSSGRVAVQLRRRLRHNVLRSYFLNRGEDHRRSTHPLELGGHSELPSSMASTLQSDGVGLRQRTSAKSSNQATTAELTPKPGNVAPRGPPPAFDVYVKLAIASLAMFALPLATYFSLVGRLGTAWAGGAAAMAANIVLIGYVVAAFLEDGEMGSKGGAQSAAQGARPNSHMVTQKDDKSK
ncbi:unnamed protein product [Parajaminaea phylloscopi]